MPFRIAAAIFFLLTLTNLAGAAEPAIDVRLARQYFDEARALAGKDAGKLWGQSLAGPLLFADRKTRQVVANERDTEGVLQPDGHIFLGRLPDRQSIANTGMNWAGVRWTMVIWPPPQDATERGILLMHESWHRIQDRLEPVMHFGVPVDRAAAR